MNQQLPAGICGSGVEIFRTNDWKVFFLQNGFKHPYSTMQIGYRQYFQAELAEDKDAFKILKYDFGLDTSDKIEEMFVGCRYGNLDYCADLINGKLNHDAPRCDRISWCVGFNIVCKIPVPKNGPLTRREYEIITFLAQGKITKEISEYLSISDTTTRTHIQRIHAKLGVNNNIEVGNWAHKHRII